MVKINSPERGQIDRTHETGSGLLNAVPGRDTTENHYNGDRPADLMGDAVDRVLEIVGVECPRPGSWEKVAGVSLREMLGLFLSREVPARFAGRREALLEVVSEAWREIEGEYEEDWDRPPYPEERQAVCTFVLNPLFQ